MKFGALFKPGVCIANSWVGEVDQKSVLFDVGLDAALGGRTVSYGLEHIEGALGRDHTPRATVHHHLQPHIITTD